MILMDNHIKEKICYHLFMTLYLGMLLYRRFGKHFNCGYKKKIMRFRNILFFDKSKEDKIIKNNFNLK